MLDTDRLVNDIAADLQRHADPAFRDLARERYKVGVGDFWGVRAPVIRDVAARSFQAVKPLPVDERLAVCERLLATGNYEQRVVAFAWAARSRRDFEARHLDVFARWLGEYVTDWSDCDDLCTHVIGELFLRYPDAAQATLDWTDSPNRWLRRGAAVALIPPARQGRHLDLVFAITDRLLADEDDLVRKGYGWLLKEASKTHPAEVFDYLMRHRDDMPRVAFRYALEKMPDDLRRRAMGK